MCLWETTYAELPHKFEAGTPNVAGGIVLGTAVDYMNSVFWQYSTTRVGIVRVRNTAITWNWRFENLWYSSNKTSVISFNIEIHPYDIGTIIDKLGIAVRTGHHCAQPIMSYFKIPGTIRASFSFYNTKEEIVKKQKLK
jgi:cysteine desulfurase/selenocysteine lyase